MQVKKLVIATGLLCGAISATTFSAEKSPLFNNPLEALPLSTQQLSVLNSDGDMIEVSPSSVDGKYSSNKKTATSLTLVNRSEDSDHASLTFAQSYLGVPIWNSDLVVLMNENNEVIQGYGDFVSDIQSDLSFVKRLSEHQKVQLLDSYVQEHYSDTVRVFRNQTIEQVIYLDSENTARNAVVISFFTDVAVGKSQPEKVIAIIEIDSEKVLEKFDALHRANRVGGAGPSGLESDNAPDYVANGASNTPPTTFIVSQDEEAGDKWCEFNEDNVDTRNANQQPQPADSAFKYPCNENTVNNYQPKNGAKSPLNDAHFNAQVTSRMFEAYLGYKPYKNNTIVQHVHYGQDMDQAFYENGQVHYGDGDYLFYPLVGLDIVAHEIAHGFTAMYGHGTERLLVNGQARAINESFSDMAGEAAKYFHLGINDWKSSEKIYRFEGALRYLDEPTKDGKSIDKAADYDPQMGPHYAAGVFNKAFHRLATTPNSLWNTKYAFITFARANLECWHPNVKFQDGADCVMRKANTARSKMVAEGLNNVPANSELKNDIRKAFAQVGVSIQTNEETESDFTFNTEFKTVNFTNTSRYFGSAIQSSDWNIVWDFGDGSENKTTLNASHEYLSEGTYIVSLTITKKSGGATDTLTTAVTVKSNYCAVEGTAFNKYFVKKVSFNTRTQTSSGSAYSNYSEPAAQSLDARKFTYEVVAGNHANTNNVEKSFQIWVDKNENGFFDSNEKLVDRQSKTSVSGTLDFVGQVGKNYRARVLVFFGYRTAAPCGVISSAEIEDYSLEWVEDNSEVAFKITHEQIDNRIEFTNSTDDARVTGWEWDFDVQGHDTNPDDYSTLKSASHLYSHTGTYRVRLKALSGNGVLSQWEQQVPFVSVTTPKFTYEADIADHRNLTFSAVGSVAPYGSTYRWDINQDNIPDLTGKTVSHTYLADGDYIVKLFIENTDKPAPGESTSKTITIEEETYTPNFTTQWNEVSGKYEVTFNNNSAEPPQKDWLTKWRLIWHFGEGSPYTNTTWDYSDGITHTYNSAGKYNASLTIKYYKDGNLIEAGRYSQQIQVGPETPSITYCDALGNTDYEHIARTTFNNQSRSNGEGAGGILVNPNDPITLYVGSNNTYTIEGGYPDGEVYAENYHVWLDVNRNGKFGDDDWFNLKQERIIKQFDQTTDVYGSGTVSGTFTIPASEFPTGTTLTRMRILQLYTGSASANQIDPCSDYGTDGSGEIEDYLVHVVKN